jgi:hypothetical protein
MGRGVYQVKSTKQKLFFELKVMNMQWTQAPNEVGWLYDENNFKQQ